MKKPLFILLFITIIIFNSCKKEDLPSPENRPASIEMVIPITIEEEDTTRLGLYLEKKVMKGNKSSTLKSISSSIKSP